MVLVCPIFHKFPPALIGRSITGQHFCKEKKKDFEVIILLELHSDQGADFMSMLFTQICELLEIDKTQLTQLNYEKKNCEGVWDDVA